MKTMETTEDVSSYGVEKRVERHKSQRSAIVVREKPMADWKKDLQIFEAGRKGLRWSWAGNQMGNVNLMCIRDLAFSNRISSREPCLHRVFPIAPPAESGI
jgi:hypothetical protein